MASRPWSEIRGRGKLAPAAIERVRREARAEVLELSLRALRAATGKTQEEMATLTRMSQSQLSRLERRDDHLLSTLQRYVRALGGELELIAVIDGERIKLRGV